MSGATNKSGPRPAAADDSHGEPLVWVYLTNGTATSGGNGPGPVQVPPAEAGALVQARLAVHGDQPPGNYLGVL